MTCRLVDPKFQPGLFDSWCHCRLAAYLGTSLPQADTCAYSTLTLSIPSSHDELRRAAWLA